MQQFPVRLYEPVRVLLLCTWYIPNPVPDRCQDSSSVTVIDELPVYQGRQYEAVNLGLHLQYVGHPDHYRLL